MLYRKILIEKWIKCRIPMSQVSILMARTFSPVYQRGDVSASQCVHVCWGWLRLQASCFGTQRYGSETTGNQSIFLLVFIKELLAYFGWFLQDYSYLQSGNSNLGLRAFHQPTYIHSIYLSRIYIFIFTSSMYCCDMCFASMAAMHHLSFS